MAGRFAGERSCVAATAVERGFAFALTRTTREDAAEAARGLELPEAALEVAAAARREP